MVSNEEHQAYLPHHILRQRIHTELHFFSNYGYNNTHVCTLGGFVNVLFCFSLLVVLLGSGGWMRIVQQRLIIFQIGHWITGSRFG